MDRRSCFFDRRKENEDTSQVKLQNDQLFYVHLFDVNQEGFHQNKSFRDARSVTDAYLTPVYFN